MTGVLLALILAASGLEFADWESRVSHGAHLVADMRRYLRDPLAYLSQRSPGARDDLHLLQTKHRVNRSARRGNTAVKPHERVLANVRYPRPTAAAPIPDLTEDLVANAAPGPLAIDFRTPDNAGLNGASTPAAGPPASADIPGSLAITPTAPKIPPAVPEPSTWSMLIWGMFLVGSGLRKRQRIVASAVVAHPPES